VSETGTIKEETVNPYKILLGKSDENRPLGRPRPR
jgi:hypothetical protein